MSRPQKHVFVCSQSRAPGHPRGSCVEKGSSDVLQGFWQALQKRNLYDQIAITFSGCIGPCQQGVNVLVYPEGVLYSNVTSSDVDTIMDEHLLGNKPVERLLAPSSAW